MTGKDDMQQNECTRNCWIAAGVVGLLVWIFASFIGSTSVMGGLFLGLIAIVLMGLFLVWALCKGSGSAADDRHHGLARAKPAAATPMAKPTAMPLQSAAPAAAAAAPAAMSEAKPSVAPKPAPKPEAKAEPKPEAKAEPKPEPKPETVAASAPKVAAKETPPAAEPAAAKAAPAKPAVAEKDEPKAQAKSAPKPETKPAAKKDAKPAPKPAKAAKAKPDDLKQIKGVAPNLEYLLHEKGVTRFAQIAAWTESEIDSFAEKIGSMGGRIRSDDWVAQAKTLSEGGSTEFAQRVKKGDVY